MTASGYFLYILGPKIINQKTCQSGQDEKLLKSKYIASKKQISQKKV